MNKQLRPSCYANASLPQRYDRLQNSPFCFEAHGERGELPKARIRELGIAKRVNSRARASHALFPRSHDTSSSRAFGQPASGKNADCFAMLTSNGLNCNR